jgi:hypothetical protein
MRLAEMLDYIEREGNWAANCDQVKGREGKGREGKGRDGKGRDGKGREGTGRLRVNGCMEKAGLVPTLIRAMCMDLRGLVQNPLL